eukprot:1365628-Amorphochlora_amoeboformis.AAC.1
MANRKLSGSIPPNCQVPSAMQFSRPLDLLARAKARVQLSTPRVNRFRFDEGARATAKPTGHHPRVRLHIQQDIQ